MYNIYNISLYYNLLGGTEEIIDFLNSADPPQSMQSMATILVLF